MYAARCGHSKVVNALLLTGVNVNVLDEVRIRECILKRVSRNFTFIVFNPDCALPSQHSLFYYTVYILMQ